MAQYGRPDATTNAASDHAAAARQASPGTGDPSSVTPPPAQHDSTTQRPGGAVWDVLETLVAAALIFVLVRTAVLNFQVDGLSMDPTLDSGELLLVNRQSYLHFDAGKLVDWVPFVDVGVHEYWVFHPPQRGDIVVLRPPIEPDRPYIKRVIGLPGDRISIHDGSVYINGSRLEEPYLNGIATAWSGTMGSEEILIPENHVFVMGDNRNNSTDSRAFGAISIDDVIGRAWISYWPKEDAGFFRAPQYLLP